MECLDANAVQDLMSGALDTGARASILGHLDTCDDCRQLIRLEAKESVRETQRDALADTRSVSPHDLALAATTVPVTTSTLASGNIALPTTTTYGRYQLGERLGAGAMGIVYRAEDPQLGREVALKLLRRPDESLTERLVREGQAMAKVSHPNVVTVYDVGKAGDSTYIAMELVRGKSLRAWQNEDRPTFAEIVEAYIAAGRGLAAAHAAGIIHRDFKPDNVLVGDDGRVRVTDFGLAAARPSGGAAPNLGDDAVSLTLEGSVLGTPAYMAPEQFTTGIVDPRTDQFNFCVALYEALYGTRPFAGKTYLTLRDRVCEGKIEPAPAGAKVSGALRAIVVRGLAVKPGDRFPSMDHLLTELGRDRARPWRRAAIGAAALAGVLVLGLVADTVVRARVVRENRQAFAATGKQSQRAAALFEGQFDAFSTLVGELPVMIDVAGFREQHEFGLATEAEDAANLQRLHDTLISADWNRFQKLSQAASRFVVEARRRVLYSSTAPADDWKHEVAGMPAIDHAYSIKGVSVSIVSYDDPAFAAAHVFGAARPHGLALMFARSLDHQDEVRGLFVQLVDGHELLAGIELDDTLLALVAPDGTSIGEVPEPLVRAALGDEIAEVDTGGTSYQVQARPVFDFAKQPIGRVVMARPLGGVISELFPGARVVFAIAAAVAFLAALATALIARRITGARV